MISKEVKNFLPVLCPARLVYFCHFWVTERLDLRHRVAFPRPTVTHRLLLGGWPAPCHTESIFDIERILPKQGIDHTVRSSLCQGQMFILLKCIHLSLSIILDCCSNLFQPSHTQCTWIMGKSFLCMGHGQDFLLGLSAFLVDCPDAWSSELSIQKAPRRNKNSWLLSVGLSDSPNHTVYAPIQWRKALSIFPIKVSLQ